MKKIALAVIAAALVAIPSMSYARSENANNKSDADACVTQANLITDWGFDHLQFIADQMAAGASKGKAWANLMDYMRSLCK